MSRRALIAKALLGLACVTVLSARDRIRAMPGYDRFTKMQPLISRGDRRRAGTGFRKETAESWKAEVRNAALAA
jgi:hypothetical protein